MAYILIILLSLLLSLTEGSQLNLIHWVPYISNYDFTNVVPSGIDRVNMRQLQQFILRFKDDSGDLRIAKIIPGYNHNVFYGINGVEKLFYDHKKYKPEILLYPKGVLQWLYVEGSRVPLEDMIPAGYIGKQKETVYICRAYKDQNNAITGSYIAGRSECMVPSHGGEKGYRNHEVLILSLYGKAVGAVVPTLNKN